MSAIGNTPDVALRDAAAVFERAGARITGPSEAVGETGREPAQVLETDQTPLSALAEIRTQNQSSNGTGEQPRSTVLTAGNSLFLNAVQLETTSGFIDGYKPPEPETAAAAAQVTGVYEAAGRNGAGGTAKALSDQDPDAARARPALNGVDAKA